MEYKYNGNTLMHGIGFNFSRFESILKHGILSYSESISENVKLCRNFYGHNKDDEISFVRGLYIDTKNDVNITYWHMLSGYYKYILNGISFVVEDVPFNDSDNVNKLDEVIVKDKVGVDKIRGIQIPSKYQDVLLSDVSYLFESKSCINIKNICDDYIEFMKGYGHSLDMVSYKKLISLLSSTSKAFSNCTLEDEKLLVENFNAILKTLDKYIAINMGMCFKRYFGFDVTVYQMLVYLVNKNKVDIPIYIIPYNKKNKGIKNDR